MSKMLRVGALLIIDAVDKDIAANERCEGGRPCGAGAVGVAKRVLEGVALEASGHNRVELMD
jgi:hypothetical protein